MKLSQVAAMSALVFGLVVAPAMAQEPGVLNTTPMLSAESHEITMVGLFWEAHPLVKIVMAMLVVASVWCWAIIFEKAVRVRRLRSRADAFEEGFWSGGSLEDLYDRIGNNPQEPMSAVFSAAMKEWRLAVDRGLPKDGHVRAGLQQRIERVMQVAQTREMGRLERNMAFLASVGSTAPFIGLFGTVFGIMTAFTDIAAQQNTSLAVVAPGIAEALFATALGLFAAIPATAAYNKFAADLGGYGERLETFADEFAAILSRYLEDRG